MPEKSTIFTREGTIAHSMAEHILLVFLEAELEQVPEYAEFLDIYAEVIADDVNACAAEGLDWKEMAETVYENYCRIVFESYLGAKLTDPNAELCIEARLKLDEYIPEGFGSSDAVLIYGDTLEVFDLKYGKGVKISAVNNEQMLCYALGAYSGDGEFYFIRSIRMTIIQPRLRHVSSWEIEEADLMDWARHELAPAAMKAYNGEGEQVPGDHCRFCKVAARCKALAAHTLEVTKEQTEPGLMTLDEIAALLPRFATVKGWISSVEEYALEAAMEGDTIPGYKVVEGRSLRKINNPSEAQERLQKAGFEQESYLKPRELKTLGDLEKALTKKGFNALLGDLVVKPEGKPTLVEESDPRPAFSKAEKDFADIMDTL